MVLKTFPGTGYLHSKDELVCSLTTAFVGEFGHIYIYVYIYIYIYIIYIYIICIYIYIYIYITSDAFVHGALSIDDKTSMKETEKVK